MLVSSSLLFALLSTSIGTSLNMEVFIFFQRFEKLYNAFA
jgi:hypothetical protein